MPKTRSSDRATTQVGEAPFELRMSWPCDDRFAQTLHSLVAMAARSPNTMAAEAFCQAVLHAVRASAGDADDDGNVSVILRRNDGAVEAVVGERVLAFHP